MTNKSSLPMRMDGLKRLVVFLTAAVIMAVPYHVEAEWPHSDEPPAMSDPSQPDFMAEAQPQSVESPAPEPPVEAPAAVETPVEVPAPAEVPAQIPDETPVPVEAPAEIPAEVPVEAPPATGTPAPEAAPAAPAAPAAGEAVQGEIPPQFSANPIMSAVPQEVKEPPR